MTKWIAVLMLAAAATVLTPGDAAAATCTENYARCLSDAGLLVEPFQSMKDLECGASYIGCVGRELVFW